MTDWAGQAMQAKTTTISIKGKPVEVDCLSLFGYDIIVKGKYLKIAQVKDDFLESRGVDAPEKIVDELKKAGYADILAYLGNFNESVPRRNPKAHQEMHYLAALKVTSYEDWFKNQIRKQERRRVRKARDEGIVVRQTPLDDQLIQGICDIFNETPVRQGKAFWHYGKDFARVKKEISTYAERSLFIGAYLGDQLIGFSKMIKCGHFARSNQFLAMEKFRNMSVNNALISELVKTCENEKIGYLVYGEWFDNSLADFKRWNGFKKLERPRYYLAVNLKGSLSLKFGLHKDINELVPSFLIDYYRNVRKTYYRYRSASMGGNR